ncbi:RHS repeat domain-containing protein [Sphingobacterium spiritivorum]|uniref:RHS repeat domain-containing protein n=1 Tax=Sphingobacterium spiritivorum TaxID=258 RepID=UPI00191A300A|nr:RHS repeat domain-containing protein [Sphingobacterium spiritivorum]QQT26036.1 hypothetical protein I6J02_20410 [Sphingobacterium spiritivorum]
MKNITKTLLFAALLFFNLSAYGQEGKEIEKVTISSPTAATLGKYADIPVNKNTGIPDISIPIYTVNSGAIKLPISLSHHASGLKVQEISGWVGSGFSLQAGGAITRTVRGLPDDRSNVLIQTKAHYVDYGYSNYFYNRGDSVISDIDFANGVLDGEPDLFFFNFNGYSGKFYFNDDRTPVLVPEQDIKIEVGMTEQSGKIEGFTITTPDGSKYFFGKNGNTGSVVPIEKTSVYSSRYGKISGTPISSWFLNKIQSADGLFSIVFAYQEEKYSYYTISPQEISGQYKDIYPPDKRDAYLVKNSFEGVRLNEIKFPNGSVRFVASASARQDLARYDPNNIIEYPNTEARALKEIQITAGDQFCKKFIFHHDYFSAYGFVPRVTYEAGITTQSDLKRLKLDSLEEVSCDLTVKAGKYKFSYFGETVASTLSYAQDYWGFNNGMNTNTTIIPDIRENGNLVKGADRKPSWPSMRAGTLKAITYPMGGVTIFDFEPHYTYTNYINYTTVSQNIHLGGDGNIFRSVPESLTLVTDGSGVLVDINNMSPINDGYVSIYDPNGILSGIGISCYKGQTRKEFVSLSAGTYSVKLSFSQAGGNPSGYPLSVSIGKNVSYSVNENSMVGGLRIKTITNQTSSTETPIVTSYSYLRDDGNSSGELYERPTFAMIKRNDMLKLVKDDGPFNANYTPYCNMNGCSNCEIAGSLMSYVKSGGDLRPMKSTQGQHIGYTQVKVSQTGNGYSQYNYYWSKFLQYPYISGPPGAVANIVVNTKVCDPNTPNYPTVPLPFEYQKGLPQFESHFDENGKPLKSIQYDYIFRENPISTPGYIVVNNERFWGSFYNLNTGRKMEEKIIETVYLPNGNDTTYKILYYRSPYHNQTTEAVTISSDGDTVTTKKQYVFDYQIPALQAIDPGVNTYLSKEITAKAALDQAITDAEINHRGNRWIALQRYKRAKVNARSEFISYRRTQFSDQINNSKTIHDAAKASAGITLKPILQMQDNFQNSTVETSKWRKNRITGAYYTSYMTDAVTAAVYPNTNEVIDFSAVELTFGHSKLSGSNITKDSRYRFENSVKYASGNIAETKAKKESPTTYLWGYQYQYPIAEITNANYSDVVSAIGGQTAIDQLNSTTVSENFIKQIMTTLRTHLRSAQVTSYTYKPLVGMSSKTNATGQTEYYDYDGFGRLSAIRDHQGNIVQTFCYNYKGVRVDCNLVSSEVPGTTDKVTIKLQSLTGSTNLSYVSVRHNVTGQIVPPVKFPDNTTQEVLLQIPRAELMSGKLSLEFNSRVYKPLTPEYRPAVDYTYKLTPAGPLWKISDGTGMNMGKLLTVPLLPIWFLPGQDFAITMDFESPPVVVPGSDFYPSSNFALQSNNVTLSGGRVTGSLVLRSLSAPSVNAGGFAYAGAFSDDSYLPSAGRQFISGNWLCEIQAGVLPRLYIKWIGSGSPAWSSGSTVSLIINYNK